MSVRQDNRQMGLHNPLLIPTNVDDIVPGTTREREVDLVEKLTKLLEFIDMIAWNEVPKDGVIRQYPFLTDGFECSGGAVPADRMGRINPSFCCGDWIVFDPKR